MQKNKTRPLSYVIYKNKLKWIRDLNMRPESIKMLEENTAISLTFGQSTIFPDMTLEGREIKENINY